MGGQGVWGPRGMVQTLTWSRLGRANGEASQRRGVARGHHERPRSVCPETCRQLVKPGVLSDTETPTHQEVPCQPMRSLAFMPTESKGRLLDRGVK